MSRARRSSRTTSAYESLKFHTLSEGLRSPIEFKVRPDGGLDLVVERSVFHRLD